MTKEIESAYQAGLLADAAYVTFNEPNYLDDTIPQWANPFVFSELTDIAYYSNGGDDVPFGTQNGGRGWALDRFDDFLARYQVVYHQPDMLNGFSATLFFDTDEQRYTVAFRGTNNIFSDLAAQNLLLAFGISSLNPWGQQHSIREFLYSAGLVDGAGNALPQFAGNVDFVGHSLGGFLSIWATYEFSDLYREVYTFNGAGITNGLHIGSHTDFVFAHIPHGVLSVQDQAKIHNFYGQEGLEFTANSLTFYRPGATEGIYIEWDGIGEYIDSVGAHSVQLLVESLSVYRLFELLDSSLDSSDITIIIEGASNQLAGSLDETISGLSQLLNLSVSYTSLSQTEAFYQELATLVGTNADLGMSVVSLSNRSPNDVAAVAEQDTEEGRAYRYALVNLVPYAIVTNVGATAATAAEFDLVGTSGNEQFSANYLEDRAIMLAALLERNMNDLDAPSTELAGTARHFEDFSTGLSFTAGQVFGLPGPPALDEFEIDRVVFGDATNNSSILGGSENDHLHGLAGADTLKGEAGNDYLEGGSGVDNLQGGEDEDVLIGGEGEDNLSGDTGNDFLSGGNGNDDYWFTPGDGGDLIHDTDGTNRLHLDGSPLSPGYRVVPGIDQWMSSDGTIVYVLDIHGTLHMVGPDNHIRIRSWNPQNFDINLMEDDSVPESPQTTNSVSGDEDPNGLEGTTANDLIQGFGGGDSVDADEGDDLVEGGDGRDILNGDAGHDVLFGGAEGDFINGGDGEDRVYANEESDLEVIHLETRGSGLQGDWLTGGLGDDTVAGDVGDDLIFGGGGRDSLWGGAGDDNLVGDNLFTSSDQNWTVSPLGTFDRLFEGFMDQTQALPNVLEGEVDAIFGGAGNDFIAGQLGADILHGDSGDDTLRGGEAGDLIFGGEGNDLVAGDHADLDVPAEFGVGGNDTIDGGAGDDSLWGEDADDILIGGEGADYLHGDSEYLEGDAHGDDRVEGGDGVDTIFGGGGNDVIYGGEDADNVDGDCATLDASYHGGDTLYGDGGDDTLAGSGGDDTLYGGEGNDQIHGDNSVSLVAADAHGNDILRGDSGDDGLYGGAGNDWLYGGSDNDFLDGDASDVVSNYGDDYLDGGSGDDQLLGRDGDDVLVGGAGYDQLQGGEGDDVYRINAGEAFFDPMQPGQVDIIQDDGGHDTLAFGAGISVADLALASDGSDITLSWGGDQAIVVQGGLHGAIESFGFGGAGQVSWGKLARQLITDPLDLEVDEDGAFVAGSESHDVVRVRSFSVKLELGRGDDTVIAEGNDNTYIFELGDGRDDIIQSDSFGNRIQFGAGITLEDISARFEQGVLEVRVGDNGDALRLHGVDPLDPLAVSPIDTFELHDGTSIGYSELVEAGLQVEGTDSDDILTGSSAADIVYAGDGADNISGYSGDDVLNGGDGDDVLDGGAGSDVLNGGVGHDTYLIHYGSGFDQIVDVPGESNTLQFTGTAQLEDLRGHIDGNDLIVQYRAGGDGVRIVDGAADQTLWNVAGAGGAALGSAVDVLAQAEPQPGGDPAYIEYLRQLWIAEAYAVVGFDLVNGGWLPLANNNYQFSSSSRYGSSISNIQVVTLDNIHYDEGFIDHSPYLEGTQESTTRVVTMQKNVSTGAAETDYAGFEPPEFLNRMHNLYNQESAWTTGVLKIPGTASSNISRAEFGNWLLWQTLFIASAQAIEVPEEPLTIEITDSVNGYFEEIRQATAGDADQEIYTTGMGTFDAGGGNDVILGAGGWEGGDLGHEGPGQFLYGNSGDDLIVGGFEGDWLLGGEGVNFLSGDEGNDAYFVDPAWTGTQIINEVISGFHHDVVLNNVANPLVDNIFIGDGGRYSTDTLVFGPGISLLSLDFEYQSYNTALWFNDIYNDVGSQVQSLMMTWGGVGEVQLLLPEPGAPLYPGEDYGVEYISFANGSRYSLLDGAVIAPRLHLGTDLSEIHIVSTVGEAIAALAGDDVLVGAGGSEVLSGGAGDDALHGGAGDDWLGGGKGSDSYHIASGGGADTIQDLAGSAGGTDRVVFGAGITELALEFARNGDNLEITGASHGLALTVLDHFLVLPGGASPSRLEAFEFNDGTVLAPEDIDALVNTVNHISGTPGDDLLVGTAQVDVIDGLAGNDTLEGLASGDTLSGGPGNDILHGEAGDDLLIGGAGVDVLDGGAGANRYQFSPGDSWDVFFVTSNDYPGGIGSHLFELPEGVALSDLQILPVGDTGELINIWYSASDVITLVGAAIVDADSGVRSPAIANHDDIRLRLSDGTILDLEQIVDMSNPLPVGQVIDGTAADDVLTGGDGDDVISGLGGADTLRGGLGADSLDGGAGNDLLYGEEGDDLLIGGSGFDQLRGGAGDDLLRGGAGVDFLNGGAGANRYEFELGGGWDLLAVTSTDFPDGAGSHELLLPAGVGTVDLRVDQIGDRGQGLNLWYSDTDVITLISAIEIDAVTGRFIPAIADAGDFRVKFAGGTEFDLQQLLDLSAPNFGAGVKLGTELANGIVADSAGSLVLGLAGNDWIAGGDSADEIYGGLGDDLMVGAGSDDILVGGAGNDYLAGGPGGDTYRFGLGSDQDFIAARAGGGSQHDVLEVTDVAYDDLWFSRTGQDLVVDVVGTNDQVQIEDWYGGSGGNNIAGGLEEIHAGDYALLFGQIELLVSAMAAYEVPAGVGVVIPEDTRLALEPTLTAVWQTAA